MSTEVKVPAIGFSTQEATLTEWLAQDGERVEKGQPLFTLELDKSVQEIEAPASGTLRIVGEVGTLYAVEALLATIED